MIINGRTFTSDLILFPDRVKDSWWRKSGHSVCLEDIEDVIKENPEVLVIGTGVSGLMRVETDVKDLVQSKGIILVVEKTEKAVQSFTAYSTEKKTIGAFHLTC